MPFPNAHACRLVNPASCMDGDDNWGQMERDHEGKKYVVIRGRKKSDGEWVDQAFRYKPETWDADAARAHCKAHDGILFEPASGDEKTAALPEGYERRCVPVTDVRVVKGDTGAVIQGHAVVYNKLSVDLGGFVEIIKPGAFKNVLARPNLDVRATFNHDPNMVLGRNRSGTLRLSEDEQGVLIQDSLPDTQYARDLEILIGRGDVNQMSFAFLVAPGGDTWAPDAETKAFTRTITEFADLYDVAVVTYPAYPDTDVALRSLAAAKSRAAASATGSGTGTGTGAGECPQEHPVSAALRRRLAKTKQEYAEFIRRQIVRESKRK